MELNVGGLKWAAFSFLVCLAILSFADLGRLAYWTVLVATTVIAYQIGSQLLLRRMRREIGEPSDATDEADNG